MDIGWILDGFEWFGWILDGFEWFRWILDGFGELSRI